MIPLSEVGSQFIFYLSIWVTLNAVGRRTRLAVFGFGLILLASLIYIVTGILWSPVAISLIAILSVMDLLLLYRIAKVGALLSVIKVREERKELGTENLSSLLEGLGQFINIALLPLIVLLLSLYPLASLLTPAEVVLPGLIGALALAYIYFTYFLSGSKQRSEQAARILAAFLELLFVMSLLAFTVVFLLSAGYLGLNYLFSSTVAVAFGFGPTFLLFSSLLRTKLKQLSEEEFKSIGEQIVKFLSRYLKITIAVVIVLSDVPTLYSFTLSADTSYMPIWVLGYVFTYGAFFNGAVRELAQLKLRAGIASEESIRKEVADSSHIRLNGKVWFSEFTAKL